MSIRPKRPASKPKPEPEPTRAEPTQAELMEFPDWYPVTHGELRRALHGIERHIEAIEEQVTRIGEYQVATQQDIDALTAALAQEDSDLNTAVTNISAEITALQQANPAVDVSALQAAVTDMGTAVAAAAALVPPATS